MADLAHGERALEQVQCRARVMTWKRDRVGLVFCYSVGDDSENQGSSTKVGSATSSISLFFSAVVWIIALLFVLLLL